MTEKSKGGAKKFFLGALLGGIAGAIAGKFIKVDTVDEEVLDPNCDCDKGEDCKCEDCKCEKPTKKSTTKKPKKESAK